MTDSQRPRRAKLLTAAEVHTCFDLLAAAIDPKPELNYQTPLDLTIAVVLSAQCTDKAVNKVTANLFPACRTPEAYLALGEERLGEAIRSIGLWRNKTKAILGLCEQLIAHHGGQVPSTRAELQALPGVGRKTANVILNIAFGQPTLAVDTHIFRVANRTGMVRESTPEKTELALLRRVPEQHLYHAHHYLILHGRYTCIARKPKCADCLIRTVCNYPQKTPPPLLHDVPR